MFKSTSSNEICIIQLRADETLWLISQKAFSHATNITFSSKRLSSYIDSKVICESGVLSTIKSIRKRRLAGDSFIEKIECMLTGTYEIDTIFEEQETLNIDDIKMFLIKNLNNKRDSYPHGHFFLVDENTNIAIEKILSGLTIASNFNDILSAFGYTEEDGGYLDGL